MPIQILSFTHNITTMLFGIFISAFFLGVKQNSKNIRTLFLFFCFGAFLYISSFLLLGENVTNWLYFAIIHLPLAIFLTSYYKYPLIPSCISIFSAYLCCQLSNWIGLLFLAITDTPWCYYVSRILITCISFFLLCKYVCHTTENIFSREKRELYIIGFFPTVYYIFDYCSTKFSSMLYSGNKLIAEFMGFIFCITYLAFLLIYFVENERKQEISQYNALMEIQLLSIQKEIEQVRKSKQNLAILRHDMRHHLNIILAQLQNHHTEKAADYIREICNSYDNTVIASYCQNEMVNSVISIYHSRFADRSITLNCDISIEEALPCPDNAFCTILSNALENSMHALEEMEISEKWTSLSISMKENHLLLQIENPVLRIPKFVNGVPTSDRKGHGIGVRSILTYVEQFNGQCQFSTSGHSFILRIII